MLFIQRYGMHTVGPIISGSLSAKDCELPASCYRSCLEFAKQQGIESVAFVALVQENFVSLIERQQKLR